MVTHVYNINLQLQPEGVCISISEFEIQNRDALWAIFADRQGIKMRVLYICNYS